MQGMAEKDIEKNISKKPKRRFSRKGTTKSTASTPPLETTSPVKFRSATLPLSTDPRTLAFHEPHSDGIFSRLRRRFRLGSKGKYDLNLQSESSPTKSRWLRRKSEEAQCPSDSHIGIHVDSTHAVAKSNSVRTQRKIKSDKEEVILVRKDKRVSVICKDKNGGAEVIFSNVKNSGEDLAVSDTEDEDPYATISSMNKEVKKLSDPNDIVTKKFSVAAKAAAVVNGSDKSWKVEDVDEYPYAKIKPGRKKLSSASDYPRESQTFKQTGFLLDKTKIEPDYESLDEIKQKQRELYLYLPDDKYTSIQNTLASSDSTKISPPISADLDPDYESLEEVKHRCHTCKLSSHSHLQEESMIAPSASVMNRLSKTDVVVSSCEGSQSGSRVSLVRLSAHQDGDSLSQVSSASATQGSKIESLSWPHDGDKSPEVRAPLASSIDSTLAVHSQEECYYDNPNVILRKHISRSITNTSEWTRRINSHPETVTKKSPAEGELVEDLINRLAPPLPLRNYQKDEIFSRGASGSARHSWSSLTNRYADIGESHQVREEDRRKSPTSSTYPTRGNLTVKSGKDSFVSQIYDRRDRSPRDFGKKELSLEHLQKHSPMFMKSNLISDKNMEPKSSDFPILSKNRQKPYLKTQLAETLGEDSGCTSLANCETKSESQVTLSPSQSAQNIIIDFSGVLAKYVVHEACLQCAHLKKPATPHCCSNSSSTSNGSKSNMLSLSVPNQDLFVGTSKNAERESVRFRTEQHSERSPKYVLVPSPGSISNEFASIVHGQPQVQTGRGQDEGKSENNIFVGESPQTDHCLFEPFGNTLLNEHNIRPNVKSLHLEYKTNQLSESQDQLDCSHSVSVNGCHESNVNSSENFITRSQDSGAWDEAMSPAFSDLDFSDSIHEHISADNKPGDTASFNGLTSPQAEDNNQFFDADMQKTIFIDLESDAEIETEDSQQLHTPVIFTKPVVYANPRLLENLISGIFTKVSGLDSAYLAHGVFKWGRYFPNLVEKKPAVETKMKAFFSFILKMLLSPDRIRRHVASVRKLQEEMDMLQLKIDKHLKDIQTLPTFHNVRLHLLGTDIIDSWQPDIPRASYFDQQDPGWLRQKSSSHLVKSSCYQPECEDFLKEPLQKIEVPAAMSRVSAAARQTLDIADIFHSEESFPDVDEMLNDFNNGQSILNLPATSAEVLDEFVQLSESRLGCRLCSTTEESDSEDEIVAVEAYSRIVSTSSCPQSSSPTENMSSVSLCRALHGELAYMTRMRKHRAPRKLLNVPGPDSECQGADSHLSWHNWCSMDELFRKLIPYISPRLDFQYLLKTYAEFKHFVLVNRKRNLEHRGCFLKKFPDQTTKCCRFEEFVFLKILRDEVKYFSHVLSTTSASKDLFLEERDIGYSLLGLSRLLLRNIHKIRSSLSKEEVGPMDRLSSMSESGDYKAFFRHSSFMKWPEEELYFSSDSTPVNTDSQKFHLLNYESFRCGSLSQALRDWKNPQAYVHDPNVLDSCQTMFGQCGNKSLEIKGVEEPRPLQEQQDFMESMEQLQQKDWYWGPISYEQATLILSSREDGSFLVRDSSDQKYLLSLSFKSLGEVHHTRIEHAKGLFSFWSQPDSHGKARICEFIEKSIQNSRDGRFLYFLRPSARGTPPLPIRLLTPVSRNFRVSSLKHLSRFVVRQHVRKDHLDLLPIPEKVKRYLRDKQYYVEILGDDQWALDGYCGRSLN